MNFFCESASRSTEPIVPTIWGFNPVNDFFLLDTSHGIFIVSNVSSWWIIKFTSALAYDLEATNFWLIMIDFWRKNHSLRIVFQKLMWKRCSKESSIDIDRSELWNVYFFASWAINFKSGDFKVITHANWKYFLSVTQSSWAISIKTLKIFVVNFSHSSSSTDISCMNKPI